MVNADVSLARYLLPSGLVHRARELYELMAPFSDQLATAGPYVGGSISWALGALATTLERPEHADGHPAAAAEIEERFGVPLFLARTRTRWARALIALGHPEDLDPAQQMLEQAEETAESLGLIAHARASGLVTSRSFTPLKSLANRRTRSVLC